ncbi:MAG: hypothetical protein R3258_07285 [Acidimicrobiia bacterium]|nr:hypothetical protein [Acidimicrobiia bacterium]
MTTPDIALAASAREWPDRLHRFLLDHGGARVVGRVMGPEQASDATFDVLLIDDVCSFLTRRLVSVVKGNGQDIIGVFAAEDGSDAKRRLLECGITDVIEMEATPSEFLDKIFSTIAHRPSVGQETRAERAKLVSIGVAGATDGVGATEIAVTLATILSVTTRTILFDLDTLWPSVAQRLDLPLHPNLRTVLDAAMHNPERTPSGVQRLGDLNVIGGVADAGRGRQVNRIEVAAVYDQLAADYDIAVADLGAYERMIQGIELVLHSIIVVGSADPVGMARLLKTLDAVRVSSHQVQVLAVVSKTQARFHEAEVRREIGLAHPLIPVITVPFDSRLQRASWEGRPLQRGPMFKSLRRMAGLISESALT